MASGEDTPPPTHTRTNRQPRNEKWKGSKIPVSSRHLPKDDSSRRKRPDPGKRRSEAPPLFSPPVSTLARKLNQSNSHASSLDGHAPTQANWKPREEGHSMRMSSPPVPAVARKMRHTHKGEGQNEIPQQANISLEGTIVRESSENSLPQVLSQTRPASPPVPAVRKQLENHQLPPIPQSSSLPVIQRSNGSDKNLTLPSIVAQPPAEGSAHTYDRQREILQQLAQLRTVSLRAPPLTPMLTFILCFTGPVVTLF